MGVAFVKISHNWIFYRLGKKNKQKHHSHRLRFECFNKRTPKSLIQFHKLVFNTISEACFIFIPSSIDLKRDLIFRLNEVKSDCTGTPIWSLHPCPIFAFYGIMTKNSVKDFLLSLFLWLAVSHSKLNVFLCLRHTLLWFAGALCFIMWYSAIW